MAEPMLDEKVVHVAEALRDAEVPHAFGGAIALAYWATPRGTEDLDLNVFVPLSDASRIRHALEPFGVRFEDEPFDAAGQALVARWGRTPMHRFFAYHAFHAECARRRRTVPFAEATIDVLSAEDIALFKLLYDRPKDRAEVREILLCRGERLDVTYLRGWLGRFVHEADPRLALLDEAMR